MQPVRLKVSDDLRRGHGSVFFRIWLALPFLLWLGIWSVAAFFVAIANWLVTLLTGRPPQPLHEFLARYVRFSTHTFAYLNLGAEPLPNFDGKPGYAIDVEIDPPRRQNRWIVAFRIVLAVPAFLFASILAGEVVFVSSAQGLQYIGGLLGTAALLGWFYALLRGRMPRGLRDLVAYALSYSAQLGAYLLVLTDRYPSSNPLTAIGPLPIRTDPVQLEVGDDLRRSRLTVFFRLPLAIPHLAWLMLWTIAVFPVAIVNWFATLVRKESPRALHGFLVKFLRYQIHVFGFLGLIANPFPGFTGAEGRYPLDLKVDDPVAQNRWAVFARLILALPAALLASAFQSLLSVIALLGWFAALFTGKMPRGLRNAGALALRYTAQTNGYLLLVTGSYPYSGPSLPPPAPAVIPAPATSPAPAV